MLTNEIKQLFESQDIAAVGTVSADGKPNIAPIYWKKVIDEKTIWFIDNFMKQTAANIKENGKMCVSFWDAQNNKGYKLVGTGVYHASGKIFNEGVKWIRSKSPAKNPRGVIEFKIEEIYNQCPGPAAGEKLA
ncbi:MAG: pyridoxamine 5'-phosphate oxidase family protein [Candidatus Micrarchaeota archaeon]